MTRLIVVAGHATWDGEKWKGGHRGQERCYEDQISTGIRLVEKGDILVFSGGRTRPELNLENSEAKSMLDWTGDITDSVVCEEFARDSFENLLYSLLLFHRKTERWPNAMTVVTFGFKGQRFNAIAAGMNLPHLRFHSAGDEFLSVSEREKATIGETLAITEMIREDSLWDPLQRGDSFRRKRLRRTPYANRKDDSYIWEVERRYGFGSLLCRIEATMPGPAGWKGFRWPWSNDTASK